MKLLRLISGPLYFLAGRIFGLWARPTIQPDVPSELINGTGAEVCYVLETGGLADNLALERAARKHGLPSPSSSFEFDGVRERARVITLRRTKGWLVQRPIGLSSPRLKRLVDASDTQGPDLLLVPVAIYWGRSPNKESSFLALLFSEGWQVAGRMRKFFATVLLGRNTLMRFSEPLPLSSIVSGDIDRDLAFRKVSRVLRVHFRQRRSATVGPDLSNRRTMVRQVLVAPGVKRAIDAEIKGGRGAREQVEKRARAYAMEIAADISYPTIRVLERLLKWLWHRIYDGVELNHIERLHQVAEDKEVIYVPCHRSHFDYLLLGYILYEEGLHTPYIAAGINLNIPVVGPILRRGGAFFLRRSFKGNRLYAAVFDAYLNAILERGHSIEYFVEGGRSRTGRLLTPKGGMLAMTVNSYVRQPKRPVVFVPVYFGYERLIEGSAFINQLGGAQKEKESLLGFIRSIGALRENFGKVYVNFAEPIELNPILDESRHDWRELDYVDGERPEWLTAVVERLGKVIMSGVNTAAAVTPISLLAYVLLATPKQKIGEDELKRQLEVTMALLRRFRYSELVTVPDMTPDEIVAHGEHMGVISRTSHDIGDVIHMSEKTAVLMTYFRNNILHLLAIPASVACCFIQGRELEHNELKRLIKLIYVFMRKELHLQWRTDDIDDVTQDAIDALKGLGILEKGRSRKVAKRPRAGSEKAYQLLMLGQSMVPMLQRFYLAIAVLVRNGSGTLTRARLEKLCEQSAERLSMIYGLHSPDFFNKTLFHDYIMKLQQTGVIRKNSEGCLEFDESLTSIGADARLVFGEEIRHSILSLTAVATEDDV